MIMGGARFLIICILCRCSFILRLYCMQIKFVKQEKMLLLFLLIGWYLFVLLFALCVFVACFVIFSVFSFVGSCLLSGLSFASCERGWAQKAIHKWLSLARERPANEPRWKTIKKRTQTGKYKQNFYSK